MDKLRKIYGFISHSIFVHIIIVLLFLLSSQAVFAKSTIVVNNEKFETDELPIFYDIPSSLVVKGVDSPFAIISISFVEDPKLILSTTANKDGVWSIDLSDTVTDFGDYRLVISSQLEGENNTTENLRLSIFDNEPLRYSIFINLKENKYYLPAVALIACGSFIIIISSIVIVRSKSQHKKKIAKNTN